MVADYPEDLRPIVKKRGSGYEAHYRVPWGCRVIKCPNGKAERYDTAAQAFVAATGALLKEFRNKTVGWGEKAESPARKAAEALFAKPKSK